MRFLFFAFFLYLYVRFIVGIVGCTYVKSSAFWVQCSKKKEGRSHFRTLSSRVGAHFLPSMLILAVGVGGAIVVAALAASLLSLLKGFLSGRLSKSDVREVLSTTTGGTLRFKRVIAIVNPVGGRARAKPVFDSVVPLLDKAGFLNVKVEITQKSGDARRIASALAKSDAKDTILVCVGGDGLLHEIVNGIADVSIEAFAHIPLALVAEGTGNGVSTSLGIRTTKHAATALLAQDIRHTDVIRVEQLDRQGNIETSCIAALSVGHGLIADHDFLAEVELRKFGWS